MLLSEHLMAHVSALGGHASGLAATARTDRWWAEPLATGLGFLSFVFYSTWAAAQGEYYYHAPYLSPFYSPPLFSDPSRLGSLPVDQVWIGPWPQFLADLWPSFLPTSPAWFILAGPLSFRLTCYYYRKFYYRSYFLSPPACAVGGLPRKNYRGETMLLLFQNLHRYTWYIAAGFIACLYYDAFTAFFRHGQFGVGVGTFVLLINATLLGGYTFGCHAARHLVGGKLDCFSCSASGKVRYGLWKRVTGLNSRHMLWAWMSMIWVGLADAYVRLVAMGVIRDFNTWN